MLSSFKSSVKKFFGIIFWKFNIFTVNFKLNQSIKCSFSFDLRLDHTFQTKICWNVRFPKKFIPEIAWPIKNTYCNCSNRSDHLLFYFFPLDLYYNHFENHYSERKKIYCKQSIMVISSVHNKGLLSNLLRNAQQCLPNPWKNLRLING